MNETFEGVFLGVLIGLAIGWFWWKYGRFLTFGMQPDGTHVIADCFGCDFSPINELGQAGVEEYISSLIRKHGLSEVARVYHSFGSDNAFTGTVVLAESHLCIHTWPEQQRVTVDVYACNVSRDNSAAVKRLYAELEQTLLRPKKSEVQVITRRKLKP